MSGLKKVDKGLSSAENFLSIVAFSLMIIDVMAIVLCRYVLHITFTVGEEIARYLMIWCAYAGAAYGFRHHSHVGVQVFADMFPKGFQPILVAIKDIVAVATVICLFIFSIMQIAKYFGSGQLTTATRIPMSIVYIIIPISMLIGIFHLCLDILHDFNKKIDINNDEVVKESEVTK